MRNGLPWFGPKKFLGWGWRPITWQGCVVTAIFLACVQALSCSSPFPHRLFVILGLVAACLAIIMTTGTRRGGHSS